MKNDKNVKRDLDEAENKITIKIDSLLHTRKEVVPDFVIIPIDIGDCVIDVSIVCEEFNEPDNIKIPVSISSE